MAKIALQDGISGEAIGKIARRAGNAVGRIGAEKRRITEAKVVQLKAPLQTRKQQLAFVREIARR
jgi:hypothetical protein